MDRLRLAVFPPRPPVSDTSWPFVNFGGNTYPLGLNQTLLGNVEQPQPGYVGLVNWAYKNNAVVFACMQVRAQLFSEARFQFRQVRGGRPGDLFGTSALSVLETPWPNGTTGDLLSRMIQDADQEGDSFIARTASDRLVRLRPDWTTIVSGSYADPEVEAWDLKAEVLGYAYQPGGYGGGSKPIFLQRQMVAHFAPIPDPLSPNRGMSWLMPIMREIAADLAATSHKLKFFENGATPNMVVTMNVSKASFEEMTEKIGKGHDGVANAYKTLYLNGPDTKVQVVGADLRQQEFKLTQGAGETRVAAAAGVPPVIVGLSEGLQAATYSNYSQARRRFADGTMRPLWRNACGSLATIVPPPSGSELWYDDRDISFLQDDMKDRAEIQHVNSQAIQVLVTAGFEPATIVDAITAGDLSRLHHTGLYSIQLQPPQPNGPPAPPPAPAVPAAPPTPETPTPGREQILFDMLTRSQERADRPQLPPVVNLTTAPTTVTIERGAVEVSAPVTIEPSVVNVTTPEVVVNLPEPVAPEPLPELAETVTELEYDADGRVIRIIEGAISSTEEPSPEGSVT
jgi:phage portal protein BeeE